VIFSSRPDKYLWMMTCGNPLGKYRNWCSVEDVQIGLYVVKGKLGSSSVTSDPREFMNNFQMASAIRDLCRLGMEFGTPDMEWFFTWGKSGKVLVIYNHCSPTRIKQHQNRNNENKRKRSY